MNENTNDEQDRRRTVITGQEQVNFVLLSSTFQPPLEKVTSVSVVPFLSNGQIVVTVEKRGPDIPGGHMLVSENSFEQTARRETLEEIGADLGELQVVRIIQSDYYGTEPDDLTYMVVYTAIIKSLKDMPTNIVQRLVLDAGEFLKRYQMPFKKEMETLISEAYKICFG